MSKEFAWQWSPTFLADIAEKMLANLDSMIYLSGNVQEHP